ncbi:MAG: nucleotidyltransferase family protein [Pseudomonadota bacterium]
MSVSHAMILAAGFGTRMKPLTLTCPKPLLPVAGRSMIDHALNHVTAAGLNHAVINLHYLGDMIRDHLARRAHPRIAYSEEDTILETGGGIRHALPLLGAGPFVVLNSDAIWAGGNPLAPLLRAWDPVRMSALLLLVPKTRARGYTRAGDFILEGGLPRRRGDAPSAPYVYTGAQIISPQAFDGAPEGAFSLNLIWDRLLAVGRLHAVLHPGAWVDVGTPAGLDEAAAALAEAAP